MKNLILILCAVFTFSCSNEKPSRVPENVQPVVETPKILLQENSGGGDLLEVGFSSRSYSGDYVEELFNEACSKDPNLKAIKDKTEQEIKQAHKLIEEFTEYESLIQQIWLDIDRNSAKIEYDSLLKSKMLALNSTAQKNFQKRIKPYKEKIGLIYKKINDLENRLTELKIRTALQMTKGFQENEIPSIKPFDSKILTLDKLSAELEKEVD